MKNISLAINAVLLVLIIVLFVMFSSLKKSMGSDGQSSSASSAGSGKSVHIAYVNADSINTGYLLMKQFKGEVQNRQGALQSEYETKGRKLQEEYAEYQQKAQAGQISQIDAQKAQQDLEAKKSELDAIQHKQDDLMKEVQERNIEIQQKVLSYINTYNKKAHFDYVLGYTNVGGNVLYANDSLDITRYILEGINKQYNDSIQKIKH